MQISVSCWSVFYDQKSPYSMIESLSQHNHDDTLHQRPNYLDDKSQNGNKYSHNTHILLAMRMKHYRPRYPSVLSAETRMRLDQKSMGSDPSGWIPIPCLLKLPLIAAKACPCLLARLAAALAQESSLQLLSSRRRGSQIHRQVQHLYENLQSPFLAALLNHFVFPPRFPRPTRPVASWPMPRPSSPDPHLSHSSDFHPLLLLLKYLHFASVLQKSTPALWMVLLAACYPCSASAFSRGLPC